MKAIHSAALGRAIEQYPKEMRRLLRNRWTTVTVNGKRYATKPVLPLR